MDEQYQMMLQFSRMLEQFDVDLNQAILELGIKHDAVSPLWQDEFRREYDARHTAFEANMKRYCYHEALAYESFLHEKLNYLRRYLSGN
jgi:hypothetical protein